MAAQVSIKMEIVLLLLFSVVSTGCSLTTAELHPVAVAQDCTSDNDSAGWACGTPCTGMPEFGLACVANKHEGDKVVVAANSLENFAYPFVPPVVGWGDSYDAGTQPCACWEWASTFSRGYVKFDLTKLVGPVESIESASISWKTKRLEGGSAKSCVKSLFEATGPWIRGKTPVNLLFDNLDATAVSGGFYGLTPQAKKWWSNPTENYGLMFDPARASTAAKSNSNCLDSLEDLRLVVKYRQKDVKWPGH